MFWEDRLNEYDNDARDLEDNFCKNQEKERNDRLIEIEQLVQGKVRPTPNLLNIKYRMEQLSKYQRFEEAAKLKDQYDLEVTIYTIIYMIVCSIRLILSRKTTFINLLNNIYKYGVWGYTKVLGTEPVIISTKDASISTIRALSKRDKKCMICM